VAKRRRTVTRSHTSSSASYRQGFSRGPAGPGGKRQLAPPSSRNNNRVWWIAGGVAVVLALVGLVYIYGIAGKGSAGAGASNPIAAPYGTGPVPTPGPTVDAAAIHPPSATPLASPLAQPAGDGTTAFIDTKYGRITIELYNQSAPVAAENFINLANAHFYNGVTFHRIVPGFVIQGGDPAGTGAGGPGYTIPDEPVIGNYTRGIVAMARTSAPNSAGSQFFIVLDDSVASTLPKSGGYVIFGKVTDGFRQALQRSERT
jgi:cyclophilin family peptidyl-prolyl cis-trans isomerase